MFNIVYDGIYGKEWRSASLVPVVLSLFESGIMSPRDRDLSIRICRSSCGLEFGSCRPFSRGFAGTGRPLGIFSLFGCFGIIVILLCLRGPSDEGAAGSAGFDTLCQTERKKYLLDYSIKNTSTIKISILIYLANSTKIFINFRNIQICMCR